MSGSVSNPLLESYDFFPYQKLKAEHILPAAQWLVTYLEKRLQDLEQDTSPPTWDHVMGVLAQMSQMHHRTTYPLAALRSMKEQADFREPYEKANQLLMPISVGIYQSKPVYEKLVALKNSQSFHKFSTAQKTALKEAILDRELSGVHLSEEKKQKYKELSEKMMLLSLKFGNNLVDRAKSFEYIITDIDALRGVPQSGLVLLSENYKNVKQKPSSATEGPWLVQLDVNSYMQIMQNADDRQLRKYIYEQFLSRGCHEDYDNTDVMKELLSLRQEVAQLLGFDHYADLSLATKMAGSVAEVHELHQQVGDACEAPFAAFISDLKEWKESLGDDESLEDWDVIYWTEKLKKARYDYDPSQLRDYLPYQQVLAGLFALIKRLFSVEFHEVAVPEECLWDEHVQCYEVRSVGSEDSWGRLFLDPFARPGLKKQGAWMAGIFGRHRDHLGELHKAMAYVVCNFWPPTEERDSLLSWYDVETLFHEFGHALQQLLSTIEVYGASGTAGVKWDVVELPSQFMENWCYHADTVNSFARHYKTGEVLPQELFEKVIASKNFAKASHYLRQITLGMIDMQIHSEVATHSDPEAALRKLLERYRNQLWPLSEVQVKQLQSFSHIFAGAYCAGYYSYLWARVMSADAFDKFEEVGLGEESPLAEVGARFRDTILALGGSEDPKEIYQKFAHRQPTIAALLRHEGLSAASSSL